MTRSIAAREVAFKGHEDNKLVADRFGDGGRPVILLHGGGQTRHAWKKTGELIARAGMTAYAFDQRGHGDSEWVASGSYHYADFAADARTLAATLDADGRGKPIAIGASLGGIAALFAEGEAAKAGAPPVFSALVLVDITPRVDLGGVAKVQGFMREHAREGFANVEEAAEAVAAYLPHRPRPRSNEGLRKNLRLHPDGRWRWHWDPRFLENRRLFTEESADLERALADAAKGLAFPTLLVRGGSSELVKDEHAREFLALVPHARFADVTGARHMVAGDRNDQFADAILRFLSELA